MVKLPPLSKMMILKIDQMYWILLALIFLVDMSYSVIDDHTSLYYCLLSLGLYVFFTSVESTPVLQFFDCTHLLEHTVHLARIYHPHISRDHVLGISVFMFACVVLQ